MRREEFRLEAMDPQTPRERLEALVDNAPEVHDVLVLNPELPEELRDYLIETSTVARKAWNLHLAEEAEEPRQFVPSPSPQPPVLHSREEPPTPPQPKKSSTGCGTSLFIIIALLLIVVPTARYVMSHSTSVDVDVKQTQPTEPAPDKIAPAPEDAIPAALIQSPSLNISCEIYEDGAFCSIYERYYAEAGLEDCWETLFSISVTETVALQCGNEYLGSEGDWVTTLEYGQSAATDGYACSSTEDGMICWNQYTGSGFSISRNGYETW